MKKLILILINIFWIAAQLAIAQSTNQNYIKTTTYLNETQTGSLTTIQYYDGLGRPMQTVQVGVTPNHHDLVTYQEYDDFGRESAAWLPRVRENNNGNFVALNTFETLSSILYQNDSKPYSLPVYEPSPLNRTVKQFGPGQDWQNNNKAVETAYLTNISGDVLLNCKLYQVGGTAQNPALTLNGDYATGQLFVTETKDEDGKETYQFTNKLGQVVLTRQVSVANVHGTLCVDTYYVYDDFGNLGFVIPPNAVGALTGNGTWTEADNTLKQFAYLYRYDERNRCIAKRLPGCEWQYMVYDKADRPVLSQDGVQRLKNEWTFYKYDDFGRMIISGIYSTATSHANLCTQFENLLVVEAFTGTGNYGYSWNVSPVVTPDKVLIVNLYDDYSRLLDQTPSLSAGLNYTTKAGYGQWYQNGSISAKGLLVGTRTKMFNGSGEIVTALYYDERNRVVQKKSTTHNGRFLNEYYKYNFINQPLNRLIEYILPNGSPIILPSDSLTESYTYEYDHAGRLEKIILNGIIIEGNSYNELGQLQNRQQGNTLSTDYTYNVRGWLKTLSESFTGFQQTLYYQDVMSGRSYNGNISQMTYQYANQPTTVPRSCQYFYDRLNRIASASLFSPLYDLDMESVSYDNQGNPTSIHRVINHQDQDGWYISYNGNQKTTVSGYIVVSGFTVPVSGSLTYNQTGSLASDSRRGIVTIRYNLLNLPDTIQFENGNAIYYTYDASGMKLQTKHITVKPNLASPITVAIGQIRPLTEMETLYTITTDYIGNHIFEGNELKMTLFPGGYIQSGYNYYYNRDYLGNNRDLVRGGGSTPSQRTEYTPFGLSFPQTVGYSETQPYKFGGKEFDTMHGLNYYDFHARFYDPHLASFNTIDPSAEKYYSISPYAYCLNNPIRYIDPLGMDTVHVLDQGTRPTDNGTAGQTYTATIYVEKNRVITGPYSGSSYPNSVSNTDNSTNFNTVNEGEHQYNNESGHSGGTKKGLNLVDANGNRNSPGTDPNGNAATMTYVNVHEGSSDNGNYNSRGSAGCITINPSDAASFFGNFDWSGSGGNTGASTGSIIIERGGNVESTKSLIGFIQRTQQRPLVSIPVPIITPFKK